MTFLETQFYHSFALTTKISSPKILYEKIILYFSDNHEKFEIPHGAVQYDRSENTNT
jgi:hypothetical protein